MADEAVSLVITVDGKRAKVGLDEVKTAAEQAGYTIDKTAKDSDGAMKALAKAIGVTAAAWKAYHVALDSINKATSAMMGTAKLNAVLATTGKYSGVTATAIAGLNKELQKNTIYSSGALEQAEALMGTFYTIGSETFPRAMQAASDMAAVTGSLESATMMLSKALDDPINGLGALSRQGFKFSEQQKEMIKTMVDAGDTLKAQTYILDALEKSQRGVAKAIADTPAGQLEKLRNEYGNLQAVLGEKLVPILVMFQKAMNATMKLVSDNIPLIAGMATAIVVALVPALYAMITALIASKAAIIAQSAAMMANPMFAAAAIVVGGITAIVLGIKQMNAATKESKESMRPDGGDTVFDEQRKALDKLSEATEKYLVLEAARKNEALPDYQKKLNEVTEKYAPALSLAMTAFQDLQAETNKMKRDFDSLKEAFRLGAAPPTEGIEAWYKNTAKRINDNIALEQKAYDKIQEIRKSQAQANSKIMSDATKADREKYAKWLEDMRMDMMTSHQKELAELKKAYDERAIVFKSGTANRYLLDEWYKQKKIAIEKEIADEVKKEHDALTSKITGDRDKVVEAYKDSMVKIYIAQNEGVINTKEAAQIEKIANAERIDGLRQITDAEEAAAYKRAAMLGFELKGHEKAKEDVNRAYLARLKDLSDALQKEEIVRDQYNAAVIRANEQRAKAERDVNRQIEIDELAMLAKLPKGYEARTRIIELELEKELEAHRYTAEQRVALEKQAAQQIATIQAEQWQKPLQNALQYADAGMTVINAISSAQQNANQKAMADIDKRHSKEMSAINKSGLAERDKQMLTEQAEAKAAQARYTQEVKQWGVDKTMAVVNGALAVTKALASAPPPMNYIAAGATAAATGIQIDVISSNKPTMEQGGFVPGHSYRGDRVDIGVNSGEAVLNPAQQRNFMALANGGMSHIRGPVQAPTRNSDSVGVGAMQGQADAETPAQAQNVTTANFTIVDNQGNFREQFQQGIRSGELLPVIREALQRAGV